MDRGIFTVLYITIFTVLVIRNDVHMTFKAAKDSHIINNQWHSVYNHTIVTFKLKKGMCE